MEKFHIVIDGGPCAGKTTGMAVLKQRLEEIGKTVIIVPEAATMYFTGGFNPGIMTSLDLQKSIFRLQLQNESFFLKEGYRYYGNKSIVFLYDRGLLTGSAYLDAPSYKERNLLFEKEVIQKFRFNGTEDLRIRYDAVMHMVTAAIGAPEAYTLENNPARREGNLEDAMILDKKTRESWLGHRHLRIIPNTEDGKQISFHSKIDNLVAAVFESLGYPKPIEIEDKFLLKSFDPSLLPNHEIIEIEQIYLISDFEERVRIRKTRNSKSYYHTIKKENISGDGRVEIERLISETELNDLLLRRNLTLFPIKKIRHCFLFENQYFEVDVFQGRLSGLFLCEREKSKVNEETHLPSFLDVAEDVTNNPSYRNKRLASLGRIIWD